MIAAGDRDDAVRGRHRRQIAPARRAIADVRVDARDLVRAQSAIDVRGERVVIEAALHPSIMPCYRPTCSRDTRVPQLPSDAREPPHVPNGAVRYCANVHVCSIVSDAIHRSPLS